ncbi:MAG: pro-sigmaK processing inhibitor BofA family protein [Anaerovoracaceae bacterium]
MSFTLEAGIFVAYAAGLFLIYLLGKLLIVPLKVVGKLLLSSLIGGVAIFILNSFGATIGIFLPLNWITAIVVGALGIPGAAGLLLFFNL